MKPWHEYTEEGIEDLADDALNAAVLLIQQRLGVESGDLAGLFFSGMAEHDVKEWFSRYIKAELRSMEAA